MRVTLDGIQTLTGDTLHSAFTDLVRWQERPYLAYRQAQSHGIVPPGIIRIDRQEQGEWFCEHTLTHPYGDLRDPKFYATPEALWLFCGCYLPDPRHQHQPPQRLSASSGDNILQTYVSYTTDGDTWAPLTPVGRAGYWLWSLLPGAMGTVYGCAYHSGTAAETSSLHLLLGTSPLRLRPMAMLYDGASVARSSGEYVYRHSSPAEPVLYAPAPGTLAVLVRTEDTMELGLSLAPYQDWRFYDTWLLLHPSAMLKTPYGWLLAAREIVETAQSSLLDDPLGKERLVTKTTTYTSLFQVQGQQVTRRLRLPSQADTGYAGLALGTEPGEVLCSYYTQQHPSLPGASVQVARLRLSS